MRHRAGFVNFKILGNLAFIPSMKPAFCNLVGLCQTCRIGFDPIKRNRVIKDLLTALVSIRSYEPNSTVTVTVDLPSGGSRTYTVQLGSAPSN